MKFKNILKRNQVKRLLYDIFTDSIREKQDSIDFDKAKKSISETFEIIETDKEKSKRI